MLNMQRLTAVQLAQFQGVPSYRIIQEKYIAGMKNERWRQLVETMHTTTSPVSAYGHQTAAPWNYETAPGSGAHHMHFGGLALHTLQNLEYAESWAAIYDKRGIAIDYDLLYATILLHDCMKRFIYTFDDTYTFIKYEDGFIAKQEDHHSWVLRELVQRGCDQKLLCAVAAIHGIDDVSLATGVNSVAIVNHYLRLADTGLMFSAEDIRPEHVIAFLSDSDWHWSGQAQAKAGQVAERIAQAPGEAANYIKLCLGSCFSYEQVGHYVERFGLEAAVSYYRTAVTDIHDNLATVD